MAGLAGAIQVCGIQYKFLDLFAFEGFGFDGIAVALLAKGNPDVYKRQASATAKAREWANIIAKGEYVVPEFPADADKLYKK